MGRYVVGIDEVGRGSLAGPVVVAAVILWPTFRLSRNRASPLKDSKKLSSKQREEWFSYFKNHPHLSYATSRVYPRQIEKVNITKAANRAALRAFSRLSKTHNLSPLPGWQAGKTLIYLDGGLYLGNGKKQRAKGKWQIVKTVVRGDEKIKAIMIASIIAKVHRDHLMTRLGKIYPKYGFEIHKGYGTKTHFRSLKKHGPSKAHRLTFLRFS